MSYGETREEKMGDLKVCKSTDAEVQLSAQKIKSGGYLFHPRDPERRAQWVFGVCKSDSDGKDLGPHHGAVAVAQMRALVDGKFNTAENRLVCLNCHPLPATEGSFTPRANGLAATTDTYVPMCNTCHPVHTLVPDLSALLMTDISMAPDGKKMVPPTETSPLPPMVKTLGCPTCHESKRPRAGEEEGGSLAREVTDATRHRVQPCQTCHPAALSPVPEIAHPPTEEEEYVFEEEE